MLGQQSQGEKNEKGLKGKIKHCIGYDLYPQSPKVHATSVQCIQMVKIGPNDNDKSIIPSVVAFQKPRMQDMRSKRPWRRALCRQYWAHLTTTRPEQASRRKT